MAGGDAILGLSFDYHDAAAALVIDGKVALAAEEERFTRVKHDPSLPLNALSWCLREADLAPQDLSGVAFYSKPFTTYERILTSHALAGPQGVRSLAPAAAKWSRSKLWVAYRIERELRRLGKCNPRIWFSEHHLSHAASAFYPSPFERAAILTFDGVGEWATSSIGCGVGGRLKLLKEMRYPDSLGLFYSTMTAQCGFEVNDGEYRLMGLAPFGEPTFVKQLEDEVIHIADDGSVQLNQRYFGYRSGRRMGSSHLDRLLGHSPPATGEPPGTLEADLARSAQVILERAILAAARHAHALTGESSVVLAGGVALNCVANARLASDGPFDDVWIQPAAGDSGAALGAALWAWHEVLCLPRDVPGDGDSMQGSLLGPEYDSGEIADWLNTIGVPFREFPSTESLCQHIASEIASGLVVGWVQGRMEFGPRALGNRSILADPRNRHMIRHVNSRVKRREPFRPFAPAVLADHAGALFDLDHPSPYMLLTASVTRSRSGFDRQRSSNDVDFASLLESERSPITACTHVDGSARVQTVERTTNPRFYSLLSAFHDHTGCPALLNTSFNGPGEPIVNSPADALRCFVACSLDLLVLGDLVISRDESSEWENRCRSSLDTA